jgi:hypothetical protein
VGQTTGSLFFDFCCPSEFSVFCLPYAMTVTPSKLLYKSLFCLITNKIKINRGQDTECRCDIATMRAEVSSALKYISLNIGDLQQFGGIVTCFEIFLYIRRLVKEDLEINV